MNALIVNFHAIFCTSHSLANDKNQLSLDSVAVMSQRYRQAIRAAVEEADVRLRKTSPEKREENEVKLYDLLSANIIWSLFEAVSFRPTDQSIVVDLVDWGRDCFTSASQLFAQVMDAIAELDLDKGKSEKIDIYWNAIFQQVISGNFKSAVMILKYHSKFRTDAAYRKMADILEEIDEILQPDRVFSYDAFNQIQEKIRVLLNQQYFNNTRYDDLKFLSGILIGEKGALQKCAQTFASNWFELLPTYTLFGAPDAEAKDVKQLAQELFKLIETPQSEMSPLDKTIFAILSMDFVTALQMICGCGKSAMWLATHIIDLLSLHHPHFLEQMGMRGKTPTTQVDLSELDLRSRIIIGYGKMLLESKELWELAPDYLMESGGGQDQAAPILSEYIGKLDWRGSSMLVERIIAVCDKYDLYQTRSDIICAVTNRCLRHQEWSSALGWALRNGSSQLIADVSRRVFVKAPPECIAQMRVFEALSDAFLVAPELCLLYRYYTFKRRQYEGRLDEAAALLHELFVENSSPVEFQAVLFEEMIRMLNTLGEISASKDTKPAAAACLDKSSVMDLFRALTIFQNQQRVRCAGEDTNRMDDEDGNHHEELDENDSLDDTKRMRKAKLQKRVRTLIDRLRPLLVDTLVNSCLK